MDESKIKWLSPWISVETDNMYFEQELQREISVSHVLFGKKVVAIGKREDCDDVLFRIYELEQTLAVVHLTYSKNREDNAIFPFTKLFKDLDDWVEKCLVPDHIDFSICEDEE